MSTLGKSIAEKQKIYLDTCYWVYLRDATIGRAKCPEHTETLGLIRDLVTSGKAICPISDAIFIELMQQTDIVTRTATAKLIDELSLGVALMNEQNRVRAELQHMLEHPTLGENVQPLKHLVWVKACYVLGYDMPVVNKFSPEQNRAMQKTSIDLFWNMSLLEFTSTDDLISPALTGLDTTASKLNDDIVKYADEIRSMPQAFIIEIIGSLTVFKSDLTVLLLQLYKRALGTSDSISKEQLEEFANKMLTMIINAFRFKPKKMAQRMPTLYVHAMCHAAIRWNKGRKFNGHWLMDLHHASAGVSYCDAMFTENPLKVLMTANHVAFDKEYGVHILSAAQDVIDYLKLQ